MTEPAPVVTLPEGAVRGIRHDGIDRFCGIPFAAPPFGARRFTLPAPVEPWEGARDATRFGPTPPQDPYFGDLGTLLGSIAIDGDDILTANVWAPVRAAGLPVMVWFYGGAFERGAAALPAYDGTTFARDGIVVASVNYRVGSEGFSVLEGAPRNLGLSDAAAGLRWVHRHIAAFGGDPDRITIVGESAGGSTVAGLLARPDTRGLVAGAIIQSGPLEAAPVAQAGLVTQQLAALVDVAPTADAFREVPPRRLIDARREQMAGRTILDGVPSFMLAVDPDALPVSPHEAMVDLPVPVLIGTNTDEYRLWFTPERLAATGEPVLQAVRAGLGISDDTLAAYRDALPDASPGELMGQLITDRMMRAPAVTLAEARHAPTFVFEFAWPSPVRDLRAAHAVELGFTFDRLRHPDAIAMAGRDAPQELADLMHGAWVRFIVDGDPGWPAYGTDRLTQVFDVVSRVEHLRRAAAIDGLRG